MATVVSYRETERAGRTVGDLHLTSGNGYNPMSGSAVGELRAALRRLDHREQPHVLTLSASGKAFSAGADLKEVKGLSPAGFGDFMGDILALFREMMAHPKPIVAIVHGDALGAGAALAQFSDLVVAATTARFGYPEALRGLASPGYLTPRLLGRQRAAEMALLGRLYTASEWFVLGQCNVVSEADEMDAAVDGLIARLAETPPDALALSKRSLRNGLTAGLEDGMAMHVELQVEALGLVRAAGRL